MVNTASRWSAADYAQNAAFVPELGAAALRLLDPLRLQGPEGAAATAESPECSAFAPAVACRPRLPGGY